MARRLRATEPVAVYATTLDSLSRAASLAEAVQQVAWLSLIVAGDDAIASVEIGLDEHRVSTAFADVPRAIVAALEVAERAAAEPVAIEDVALVNVGQIGVIAVWIRTAALLVPLRLRAQRRELEPNRPYDETAFIAAVLAIGTRIAESH